MHSISFYVWKFLAARGLQNTYRHHKDISAMRRSIDNNSKLFIRLDPKASISKIDHGSLKGDWIKPVSMRSEIIILYLHGGSFIMGKPENFRTFLTYLCPRVKAEILALDYPLAPEYPFPAGLENAHEAYKWILKSGYDPGKIVIAGDSAGGGLALSLAQRIRDSKEPMPASIVCLNPWLDLDLDYSKLNDALKKDKFLSAPVAELSIKCYVKDEKRNNPLISPLYADLTGFPPIFLQTGTKDTLVDQARDFEERAKKQNAVITLDIWDGMPHDWQVIMVSNVKESREAIDNICTFINSTTAYSKKNKTTFAHL